MLHSLPALLNDLEQKLIAGQDPLPLLASVRWAEVIEWPRDVQEASRLKARLASITGLINGLQAPLRATLASLNGPGPYAAKGGAHLPATLSLRLHQSA